MRKSSDLWVSTTPSEFIEQLNIDSWGKVKKTKKSKVNYIDITATLDIETTNRDYDGFAYTFQMNIDGKNCLVRYIEDFIEIVETIRHRTDGRLVFYIHNLGYEFYYMIQILKSEWGIADALYTKPKKPLYVVFGNNIEFRDSLKLFQKSLAMATKGCPHEKLVGDLDYSKYRTPDTPLSPDEWNYCINDVQGLYEAIERLKKEHNYNQATIPLTNTAMVIEEVNRCIAGDMETMLAMERLKLNKIQMRLAYNCMAGGDTHGSRWKAGKIYDNCNSYDFKSAHPSQQLLRKFPCGEVHTVGNCEEEDLKNLIDSDHGWLGKVLIEDFRIIPGNPDPTISVSKCESITGQLGLDNGRLLGADAAIVYMDSNDYQRFREAYRYADISGIEILEFRLDYLPGAFRKSIFEKFKVKETMHDSPLYMFSKICVNTIFGACAQKVIRDEYTLTIGDDIESEKLSWEDNLESKSEHQVAKKQSLKFPFLWGLWTASLSRLELWQMLKIVGWENVIYWDTDSCKYEGAKVPAIEEIYNNRVREECENREAVVTQASGKKVYIGVAEDEYPDVDYGYRKFTFLHAKCYAAERWNKKEKRYEIETTISGVDKKKGAAAMRGDISNLHDGFFIADAGGLKLSYHARPIIERTFGKRKTKTASYIVMEPREYLISSGIPDTIEEADYEILA